MIEGVLGVIASLGSAAAQNVFLSIGEQAVKKFKKSRDWKKLVVESGDFFIQDDQKESDFFDDLLLVLSKDNLSEIAKNSESADGYVLKDKLFKSFSKLMNKYEIPYEIAESYITRIIYVILEGLKSINPQKYQEYFLQDWRDDEKNSMLELRQRIDKITNELERYNREKLEISTSGEVDVNLRKSTISPSIGIDFFVNDDENFQNKFKDMRYEELIFVRGRSREETIYCVLNELWRIKDHRPIYVVRNLESWEKLQSMGIKGNIYIPWFYADEIVAIENNTNIFVIDENTPTFGKSVLELRPRTQDTLLNCLQDAGLEYSKAYSLLSDTHGLYSQMKKQIFKGGYLKVPSWMNKVSEKAKKTCLLIGSWEESEGDKKVIESLYEDSYDKFIEEVLPYVKGEDPLLYKVNYNGKVSYYLASLENIWSYLDVIFNEKIWGVFTEEVFKVIKASEELFTYNSTDRLRAQFKGERLFWSVTIRRGMLKTLLIKATFSRDEENQWHLDNLIETILKDIKTDKQWIYISNFWRELCEISPTSVMKRIENEWDDDSGLLSLFQNQTNDLFFERNPYIEILWGVEQLLLQKKFFWRAFRWLLKLDSKQFQYETNSPKNTLINVFCTSINVCCLQSADDKIKAARIAFEINYNNTWQYLFTSINHNISIGISELSAPKYREYCKLQTTTIEEMKNSELGYCQLLLKHMDFSVNRWKKMINLSGTVTNNLRKSIFKKCLNELSKMSDEEIILIKNEVRSLIYRHRYYSSSNWAMTENILLEYEKFLDEIYIETKEYEYSYLFNRDCPLRNPSPYDKEGNEKITEGLIKNKISEFHSKNYDLAKLVRICAKEPHSTLGIYLAKFWNSGEWDYKVFKCLLEIQKSGDLALDYLRNISGSKYIDYGEIIEELTNYSYSTEILARVYRSEAERATDIPLVEQASEKIKQEFWRTSVYCKECNDSWVISKSKEYANLNVYLDQLHQIHLRRSLTAEEIFNCFEGIERMSYSSGNYWLMGYNVEEFISIIQNAYINDIDKCNRIIQIEFFFSNFLEWEQMKCLNKKIKSSPEIFTQLVCGIFKSDHDKADDLSIDKKYVQNIFSIYDIAHFCPAEINGRVDESELENWINKYKALLIENNRERLFTSTLGRLFSFSPLGDDGHEPCESVRKMIEKYGDDKMLNRYQIEVFNRRGIFSPCAGKEELKIAENFRSNAEFLESSYPKTAQIFYELSNRYEFEAKKQRVDAENGEEVRGNL